ncbi:MAG TPA: SUMF1/EgtB/PvdO family nonheme iron enzyme, partial [Kiritimatiellia bacterium]|nr:SUMF1/EgtB/PvdO family nonheme iron enzyme [Kiritimatiellia bacterium]
SPIGVCFQVQNTYYGGAQNVAHPQYACHLPVGQKRPNAYGLYDMIGNICEWCSGWFDAGQTLRPVRGGELHMSGEGLGVGYCRGKTASLVSAEYGFRLACGIQ